MPVTSWSATPALNTLDSGTAGSGGTITLDGAIQKPSDVDNVQRSHMAQIATFNSLPTFGDGIYFTTTSAFTIRATTSDGSDSAALWIAGGGAATTARGAIAIVYGNEGLSPGDIRLIPGTAAANGVSIEGKLSISDASAGQIVFPATQNASANANTLDDYEEGTWTPTVAFGGASVGITYSAQAGKYTKIGNLVCAAVDITLSSKGSSTGTMTVSLPFTSSGISTGSVGLYSGFSGLTGTPIVFTSSTATFQLSQTGAAASSAITDTLATATSRVIASISFFV